MGLKEIRAESRNQSIVLVTDISKKKFEILKYADSCDVVVNIERRLGRDFYFEGQSINPLKIDFGTTIIVKCNNEEIECISDKGNIYDLETETFKLNIFKECFYWQSDTQC